MPATAPRPRSPAQIEAARRNGARSRGPVTARRQSPQLPQRPQARPRRPGAFRARGRSPSELEELTARLIAEVDPESEIEARLVKRMAIAFWKSERAERIEVALFDAAPKLRPPQAGFQWEIADPLTTFDVKRFNAVRGYQAQQGRELSRCLKELRLLRRERSRNARTNPRATSRNEPGTPPDRRQRRRPESRSRPPASGREPARCRTNPVLLVCGRRVRHPAPAGAGCAGSEIGTNPGYEPEWLSVIPPRIHVSPNG